MSLRLFPAENDLKFAFFRAYGAKSVSVHRGGEQIKTPDFYDFPQNASWPPLPLKKLGFSVCVGAWLAPIRRVQ